ncbi:MAG: hypothetical protein AB9856_04795 [Cellulosilyticaceae bacterium]
MTANITKTLQEEKEQAVEMGKRGGKIEGEKEKALEVARKMLAKGMELQEILEITGLSKQDIEGLD